MSYDINPLYEAMLQEPAAPGSLTAWQGLHLSWAIKNREYRLAAKFLPEFSVELLALEALREAVSNHVNALHALVANSWAIQEERATSQFRAQVSHDKQNRVTRSECVRKLLQQMPFQLDSQEKQRSQDSLQQLFRSVQQACNALQGLLDASASPPECASAALPELDSPPGQTRPSNPAVSTQSSSSSLLGSSHSPFDEGGNTPIPTTTEDA